MKNKKTIFTCIVLVLLLLVCIENAARLAFFIASTEGISNWPELLKVILYNTVTTVIALASVIYMLACTINNLIKKGKEMS